MSESAATRRYWDRITSAPGHVPSDLVRYYVYWKIFYVLAGVSHLLMLFLFFGTGVTFMAVFNLFSVSLFIAAFVFLKRGRYRLAYWLGCCELVLHGVAATVCVGLEFGFNLYPFLVVVLAFIQPFYGWRIALTIALAALASAGLVTAYGYANEPLYLIPERFEATLRIVPVVSWPLYVLAMVLPFIRASARAEKELAAAYGESEHLLLNILPKSIALRLKDTEGMIADERERVAILFVDIVGFTAMSGRLRPAEVVSLLNDVFNAIDELVARYGVEKIKTIGDAYMVVAGVPDPIADPDVRIARLALEIRDAVGRFAWPGTGEPVSVRIGFNVGGVVAGVIGNRKFAYDLWGDAVNLAARMETTGEPGRIQVPAEVAEALRDRFVFEPRGEVEVKGKGLVATSFLVGETGR